MEKKDDSVAMDYKDIERFMKTNNMHDVSLIEIHQDDRFAQLELQEQFMISACLHLENKMEQFIERETGKNGDNFSKDKCFRFIYKDPDNMDNHAYCFIFGCSGGKPYIITQKTIKDTRVLATIYQEAEFKKLFGEPFLWNSVKDKKSCAFTGLTMLKDLSAEHIKNIVNNEQNSQILDKDRYPIVSYKTIIPSNETVIPESMVLVSQNAAGIEKYRPKLYEILNKCHHIQNKNGVKYNTYAQKKIKDFKSLK